MLCEVILANEFQGKIGGEGMTVDGLDIHIIFLVTVKMDQVLHRNTQLLPLTYIVALFFD